MAKAPITVVWASTTSNKAVLDTTAQGNGIVFESDIVSNIINEALFINSQATRNLQVMGGYYDGGQEYKNYQYCSQIEFVGGEYVLNYYMATQDNPTLAPTNATTYQQGTTDMEIPTNGSSVQSGWQQLNTVPNQSNIAYKNKENHFTQDNMFDRLGDSRLKSGATLACQNGKLQLSGFYISNTDDSSGNIRLFYTKGFNNTKLLNIKANSGDKVGITLGEEDKSFFAHLWSTGVEVRYTTTDQRDYTTIDSSGITTGQYTRTRINRTAQLQGATMVLYEDADYSGSFSSSTRGCKITLKANQFTYPPVAVAQPYATLEFEASSKGTIYNTIWFKTKPNYSQAMEFISNTTIANAQFGSITRGIDPVWEQDYATANYVNQKLQELFDYLDTRLATIENKLGISNAKSRARGAIDARAMINNIAVPKSKLAELFDRLENLEGYEGVLGYSNEEERLELSKVKDNEEAVMQVMDSIKARMEAEAKEREAQEAQQKQENSVDAENQEVKE